MAIQKASTKSRTTIVSVVAAILFAIGIALLILEKTHVINLYEKTATPTTEDAKTTSTALTAQEDFTDGGDREPGSSIRENGGSGGITDTNGTFNGEVEMSNPITSTSGEIALFSPKNNDFVSSGQQIAGTSQLPKVTYRLIDSLSGVISTGELSVVNGKFSGRLDFETHAQEGRLDLYATRFDGSEFSNIEVPVRFR